MANDRLRSTLRSTGFSESALAEELGVDPKTVQRWITKGRSPHRLTATRAAKILDVPAEWLWPDLEKSETGVAGGEVVHFYPHRAQVPRNVWLELVCGAKRQIDFITYASLFMGEENPEAIQIMKHKAANGVRIRIGLGDPDSPEVALRGREEGMPEGIPGRSGWPWPTTGRLSESPSVTFHLHRTTLYNSIYRFDDQMMINQHAYGTYGYIAPILHLRKVEGADLFTMYERSFELAWAESYPYDSAA